MEFDRISALPDSLLAHILSYLSIFDSFKTSLLSKRWEFIWLKVSVLDLTTTVKLSLREEAMLRLMRRFVELNRGCGSCLQNFNITAELSRGYGYYNSRKEVKEITFLDFSQEKKKVMYYDSEHCNNGIMELIAEVIHRGVQHLEVNMCEKMHPGAVSLMPKYVYVGKTLVSLKLANVGLEDTRFAASLPNLKMMHLRNICYKNEDGLFIIKKLLSASPLLEDLTFDFPEFVKSTRSVIMQDLFWKPKPKIFPVPRKQNRDYVSVPRKPNRFYVSDSLQLKETLTNVPQCLISTLEYVKINRLILKEESHNELIKKENSGIKLVNYFLENSAVLKKLTLSFIHASIANQDSESESYKKLLTSTKLSPTCQVVFD